MQITIIGWYGTETIGDRAILAGLISLFNQTYDEFEIKLGSLHPFFTERTINEDYSFYREIIQKDIKIEIFNSQNQKELLKAIKTSDLVAMGGGPLMDLDELFMVEYAFKKAKKLGVCTALLGCGVGPLFHKKYRKSVLEISSYSDLVIVRDSKSKENLEEIYAEFNKSMDIHLVNVSYDPAVECTLKFNALYTKFPKDYIAVNLREFPVEYTKKSHSNNINLGLIEFIEQLARKYADKKIRLIPMHYFYIGGDDRVFLNRIKFEVAKENITIQNENLTLKETMEVYQNADFCIGMRFHAVVLQTIASGKNYILDYTEPRKGKIFGFLSDIDEKGFFKNRYISLQKDEITINIIEKTDAIFDFNEEKVRERLNIYIKKLKEIQL